MSKIGIVIGREYFTRVKKRSFIVLTLLMPLLFVGLAFGTLFLSTISGSDQKLIVVNDITGEYVPVLKGNDQYIVLPDNEFSEFRKSNDLPVYATLIITDDLLTHPNAITLLSETQLQGSAEQLITSQLNEYLSEKKLALHNIPNLKEILEESKVNIRINTLKTDKAGNETASSSDVAAVLGMVFTLLIYMFIFSYGAMVMQGVIEEKTNRIIEVMISSVKPFDLMMGKLIGIGLVGLTQFAIWAGLLILPLAGGSILFKENLAALNVTELLISSNLIELCLYFILYFVGGYMMYASLFAAIGAMVDNQEDTQQYMMPVTFLLIFAFYAGFYSSQNPDGPLAFWTSLIPLTSPIVMMTRIPFGVPWWELLLSIALLFGTVILIVALAAKIYRVGILMYGKKASYSEIIKWLKY